MRITDLRRIVNYRRISQALFLLIFLFLFIQTEARGRDELSYPAKFFLDFDPLILFASLLSSHAITAALLLSLVTLALTIFLGRFFCGWVCPLGTLNTMVSALKKRRKRKISDKWLKAKYSLLIILLVSSVFTLQLVGIFDPISLLIRSLSVSIYPAFNHATRAFFDFVYDRDIRGVVRVSEAVYDYLKASVLSFNQTVYQQSLFLGLLFLGILALNLADRRFWCKYLCPLGALLGLFSRYSLLNRRVTAECNSCNICALDCHGAAMPEKRDRWKKAECMFCWNCEESCPSNAMEFGFRFESGRGIDLGRRNVLASIAGGLAIVPLFRSSAAAKRGSFFNPALIRPPGSLPETDFLARCVKCGECMKVCLTNGLQPALLQAGAEGVWSPVLVPRLGYCEYNCTLCGQVCPTGAIKRLSRQEKHETKIGLAMIDKGRCLPWAQSTPCIVCEEVCPTPKKAIWFEETTVRDRDGNQRVVKQPRVDLHLCIGCGICENKCPVVGQPAIYVISTGESRSAENQVLLPGI